MALKVLTPIGTDGGITEQLYIRISNYQFNKFGSASFNLQLFLKEEDSKHASMMPFQGNVRNNQIGEILYVPLQKEVVVTKTGVRPTVKEVVHEREIAVDGAEPIIEEFTTYEPSTEEYTWEEKTSVPDLSSLVGVDIFTFGYAKLKEKLEGLFPNVEILDC